jgi:hypothetical protein
MRTKAIKLTAEHASSTLTLCAYAFGLIPAKRIHNDTVRDPAGASESVNVTAPPIGYCAR